MTSTSSARSMLLASASVMDESKAYRTLDGHLRGGDNALLALDNVHSAVLWEDKEDAVAFAAVIRYAPGKAYACVSEVAPSLVDKQVRVVGDRVTNGREHVEQIATQKEGLRDALLEPLWKTHLIRKSRTAHENVMDLAVVDALGSEDLELTKNVTVDIVETDALVGDALKTHLAVWRDRVGFVVGDPRDLFEVVIEAGEIGAFVKGLLATTDDGEVPEYNVRTDFDSEDMNVYDKRVTALSRDSYLAFVRGLPNSSARMAYGADGGNIPCGTCFVFDGTLMHLYAESDAAAISLLHSVLSSWPSGKSFTCSVQRDTLINRVVEGMQTGVVRRRIHRFHTTAPPANIKWDSVYAFNAGVNIV